MRVCFTAVRRRALLAPLGAFCLALLWALWPARAHADTIGAGCYVAELIAVINIANSTPVTDTIMLAPGCTYTLTAVDSTFPGAGSLGLPYIKYPLTIEGQGATIQRDPSAPEFRIFFIEQTSLTLRHLTLAGGKVSGAGVPGYGGAIVQNLGVLNIEDSALADNSAASGGALFATASAQTTVLRSTWRNNSATGVNGGGAIFGAGTLNIANSTFSGNHADAGGGAVVVPQGTAATLDHVTILGNSTGNTGGSLYSAGAITLTNSIVAGRLTGANCDFPVGTQVRSYNLTDDASCGSGFTQVDPTALQVGPLQNNGGSTLTHALLTNSPAINAGDPNYAGEPYDQRGNPNLRVRDGRTDIGAFEADAAKVGGAVTGLAGSGLVLALNGVYTLPVAADGLFTFAPFLVSGDAYAVTVISQPHNRPQICTVTNGSGTISGAEVTNVAITCAPDQRTLIVVRRGSGGGTVTSSPTAINCGATCSAPIDLGTVVTLTATPATSSTFGGWADDCTGQTCVVTMSAARNITATFTLKTFALTVTKTGTGAGGVTGIPANAATLGYGTVITLTAAPAISSTFAGWSGACVGVGVCNVTMTSTRSVTATFTLKQFDVGMPPTSARGTVQVQALSPAADSSAARFPLRVTVGAANTAAPDQTAALYPYGTVLQLTAMPNPGYVFTAWGGDLTGAQNPRTVTITGPLTVTAQFDFALHTWIPFVTNGPAGAAQ